MGRSSAFRFEYEKTEYQEPDTHLCSKPAWCFSFVAIISIFGVFAYVNNFWVDYPTADSLRIVDVPSLTFQPKSLADLLLDPSKASITLSLLLSLNITNPNKWISVDITEAKALVDYTPTVQNSEGAGSYRIASGELDYPVKLVEGGTTTITFEVNTTRSQASGSQLVPLARDIIYDCMIGKSGVKVEDRALAVRITVTTLRARAWGIWGFSFKDLVIEGLSIPCVPGTGGG